MRYKLNGFQEYREKLFRRQDITDAEVRYLTKQLTNFITKKKKIDKSRLRVSIKGREIIIVTSEKWSGYKIAEIEDVTNTHCTNKDGGYYRFLFLKDEDLVKFHPRRQVNVDNLKVSLSKIQNKITLLSYADKNAKKEIDLIKTQLDIVIKKVNELDISNELLETIQNIIQRINELDDNKATNNDIILLQEALNEKADKNHTHNTSQIIDLDVSDFDVNMLLSELTENIRQI